VLADVRREKIFDYVCLHPQLCVGDGEEFLKVLLAGKDADRLYIAACDPRMQEKMFRDAFDAVGFDRSRLVSLDIRNKTTEEAVEGVQSFLGKRAPKWKERWWMTPLAISGAIAWKHQDKEELPMAIRAKSYRYTISVRWTGEKKGALAAAGKPPVEVATPPEFKGHEGVWSPEDSCSRRSSSAPGSRSGRARRPPRRRKYSIKRSGTVSFRTPSEPKWYSSRRSSERGRVSRIAGFQESTGANDGVDRHRTDSLLAEHGFGRRPQDWFSGGLGVTLRFFFDLI
jgi:hypothetical protein